MPFAHEHHFLHTECVLVSVQIKLRNLEHQNGVLLAKYQAVMSMKDRRGPEGAQVCLGRSASSEIEQRFLTHIFAPPFPSASLALHLTAAPALGDGRGGSCGVARAGSGGVIGGERGRPVASLESRPLFPESPSQDGS